MLRRPTQGQQLRLQGYIEAIGLLTTKVGTNLTIISWQAPCDGSVVNRLTAGKPNDFLYSLILRKSFVLL